MANNKLTDLNNHLFAQLERLGDERLDSEQLEIELKRTKAMVTVAKPIINNANVMLQAFKFAVEEVPVNQALPDQFGLNLEQKPKKL